MGGYSRDHALLRFRQAPVQKAKIDLAQTFDNSFADRALKKYAGKR